MGGLTEATGHGRPLILLLCPLARRKAGRWFMSPTQRTLKYLRDHGHRVQVVERWQPQSRRRIDLFGCIDIVGLDVNIFTGKATVTGWQACAGSSIAARQAKVEAECLPAIREWMHAGCGFCVIGWRKLKGKGRQQWFPLIREAILTSDGIEWEEVEL